VRPYPDHHDTANQRQNLRLWRIYGLTVALLTVIGATPASAQFTARDGFTADGTKQWSFEVSPYLYLPNISATIGLAHPPGFDVSVNQNRPTLSKLATTLTGAFLGFSLVRYANVSAELHIMYLAAAATKTYPPLLPGNSGANLKSTVSGVLVSPGVGYQVLPYDADSKISLDARAGFTYHSISATAGFDRSVLGDVSVNNDFVQPWIGARISYYPSPNWRISSDAALTGLGLERGALGWNGNVAVSYLITSTIDVTLGYQATQIRRGGDPMANGANRSLNLLAYGPVLAFGFRF
jgi:hypothetical protein